jgi:hypothetical protein
MNFIGSALLSFVAMVQVHMGSVNLLRTIVIKIDSNRLSSHNQTHSFLIAGMP